MPGPSLSCARTRQQQHEHRAPDPHRPHALADTPAYQPPVLGVEVVLPRPHPLTAAASLDPDLRLHEPPDQEGSLLVLLRNLDHVELILRR